MNFMMVALPWTALISQVDRKQGTITESLRKGGIYGQRNWRRFSVF